jgi:hypothetical protein
MIKANDQHNQINRCKRSASWHVVGLAELGLPSLRREYEWVQVFRRVRTWLASRVGSGKRAVEDSKEDSPIKPGIRDKQWRLRKQATICINVGPYIP